MRKAVIPGLAFALMASGVAAELPQAGDWLIRVGVHYIDPKSSNANLGESVIDVRSDWSPTFNVSYFFTGNIALELQAATPFKHDIRLDGVKVAETKHLPPTLNVQYHLPLGNFKPYAGVGLNWTTFFDEKTFGPLEDARLSLDDSFGFNAQLGADYAFAERWFVNAEFRWIDIDTDAELDGEPLVTVKIDPVVFALNVGFRF